MRKNRFYENRQAIKAICDRDGCDVSTASHKLAHERGWTGYEAEMDEWADIQRSYMQHPTKTLADLWA